MRRQLRSGVAMAVVGWQLQLQFDPWPRNFHMPQVWPCQEQKKIYVYRSMAPLSHFRPVALAPTFHTMVSRVHRACVPPWCWVTGVKRPRHHRQVRQVTGVSKPCQRFLGLHARHRTEGPNLRALHPPPQNLGHVFSVEQFQRIFTEVIFPLWKCI